MNNIATAQSDFDHLFEHLTGNAPFPWQRRLYGELVEKQYRIQCDVPTGLGKTSVIAMWLLALTHHVRNGSLDRFPRRLVYVVNRRTVVDQATREAEHLRITLRTKNELRTIADTLRGLSVDPNEKTPLAISTLRGQFADNAEWRNDPARPAVIVGTVDMVGSRLLFAGYGCGFRSKPLHAGFLGQDVLFIHDEAHLEPPFQELISAIRAEQKRCSEFGEFHVMELTATSRAEQVNESQIFTEEDQRDERVSKRFEAKKGIRFHAVTEKKQLPDRAADLALKHKNSGEAILVFLRELEHVQKVRQKLEKANPEKVEVLTGTLRGLERDELAKTNRVFARFLPKPEVEPVHGTVYLVCTSAGEVGVDISADHMVCDLTPFDSMAQRLGRVNRFGKGDASIDVVHLSANKSSELTENGGSGAELSAIDGEMSSEKEVTEGKQVKDGNEKTAPFELAKERTLVLLQQLPLRSNGSFDASPAGLRTLPAGARQAAFTPVPLIRTVSDILFDVWALTSVRETLPGRPPVADWLHGIAAWEPPDTYVAWREEVEFLNDALLERYKPEDLLDDYPLKPQESLRDRTDRVSRHLESMAERCPELSAWLIEPDGQVRVFTLGQLVEKNRRNKPVVDLAECTVVLSPVAGGLDKQGILNGGTPFEESDRHRYDVSGQWCDEAGRARRCRVWDEEDAPEGMRLVRTIDLRPDSEEPGEEGEQLRRRFWRWYVRPRFADDDGSRTARTEQDLGAHLQAVENMANRLVKRLDLKQSEAMAVKLAARWHDLGKNRATWQRSIGNRDFPRNVLAKSGAGMRPIDITPYRHEFGSLLEAKNLPEFQKLGPEVQDLVLHLVAAHHGRARPHFPEEEAFDPDHAEADATTIALEVPRRFARLQRKYGRWGLAYLESLVRAADALASQALGSRDAQNENVTEEPTE